MRFELFDAFGYLLNLTEVYVSLEPRFKVNSVCIDLMLTHCWVDRLTLLRWYPIVRLTSWMKSTAMSATE